MFITFEGIEGSGKSTHLRQLAKHLRARGRRVVETREPGGTAAGAAIRRLLLGPDAAPLTSLAELFLYCADRTQHVREVIRPALDAGQIVLSDRFSDSTLAYQGYARGLELETVRALDARARGGVWPDLTFLLDCPVADGLARARGRADGRPLRAGDARLPRARPPGLLDARRRGARTLLRPRRGRAHRAGARARHRRGRGAARGPRVTLGRVVGHAGAAARLARAAAEGRVPAAVLLVGPAG